MIVVTSAGNGNVPYGDSWNLDKVQQSPVCNEEEGVNMIIGVGAVNSDNKMPSWSNTGSYVDIWAPGIDILSTSMPGLDFHDQLYSIDGQGYYSKSSGTSFSAPIVTGVVSLLKAKYPSLTSEEAIKLLIENSNNGVVDAYATLNANFTPAHQQTTVKNTTSKSEQKNVSDSNTEDNEDNFDDVAKSHRNRNAISYLHDRKIIQGYPDGSFKPNQTVNRAELLKILIEGAWEMTPPEDEYNNCFPDVTDQWFAKYVCFAKENGIVEGYPDGTFKPEQTVNKVEALKMLFITMAVLLPEEVDEEPFEDVNTDEWFSPYVYKAKKLGLLEETGSTFSPGGGMKRGGICENLYRLLINENANSPEYN